mmetsp:Transcript_19670/g.36715  ORF Transcript_19670/g.36715 Transcript_19670/m.36715 type:complete len:197 (-) Transcript_19670:49-639(-)|eukprot:CAMPEP_0178740898 /NCGR_PEP_ID=MMETSP0744-20121128/4837_1 /TAXON_ID=913974 /ORGANISM="Nitzschia punctata, Strain CCMP561" /LENGTH=196 /DNA_ID=CAMNT_0020393705 /DNA_START=278 /DNA_END=868 /DNA_ORIENTATION=-
MRYCSVVAVVVFIEASLLAPSAVAFSPWTLSPSSPTSYYQGSIASFHQSHHGRHKLKLHESKDADSKETQGEFVNNGPNAWLSPYLDLFGMSEGKKLVYALPLPFDDDNSNDSKVNDAEAARLREEAAKNLINIGTEERERRAQASKVAGVVTAVYATWAALIADTGGLEGHIFRFLTIFPLFFTLGYKLSAEQGL